VIKLVKKLGLKKFIKQLVQCVLWWPASPKVTYFFGEIFFKLISMRSLSKRDLNLTKVKKILVIRLDEIGDVVMTTPFLRELRRNLPNAWITLAVKPQVYNLVELCPYVNEVLVYDWHVPRLFKPLQRHWRALRLARKHLWKRRFDLAILPRWDTDDYHATFVAYFSGAPWRVGYSEKVNVQKRRFNKGYDRLLTHVLEDDTLKHEVAHNLDVIRFLGGTIQEDRLEIWVGGEDEAFAEQVLINHNVGGEELLVGLGPGAGSPKRKWPLDSFLEIGNWLVKEYRAKLLIIGGSSDRDLGQILKQHLGDSVINMAGLTTLRQAAALLKHCRLFVGNDAGPIHMAAAVGTPVVELSCHPATGSPYSTNSPNRFGPWSVKNIVLQPDKPTPPCQEMCVIDSQPHCILGITVEQVKRSIEAMIEEIIKSI